MTADSSGPAADGDLPGPQQRLAQAFAGQVGLWLATSPLDLADRAAVAVAAEAVALATTAGHVCIALDDIDGHEPVALRRALIASGLVAPASGASGASRQRDAQPLALDDDNRLYLHRYCDFERRLADRLRLAMTTPAIEPSPSTRHYLVELFAANQPRLAGRLDWQRLAAAQALRSKLTIISGGPGTGKTTTVVNLLASLLDQSPALRIALTAPTGKAAARMTEAITSRSAHLPTAIRERMPAAAATVHRLLGAGSQPGRFRHDARRPLAVDVLVVDEASMLDLALATRLLEAVPDHAKIILLGDKDQLAAVEAGAVFAELSATTAWSPATCTALAAITGDEAARLAEAARPGAAGPASPAREALGNQVIWLRDSWRFNDASPIGRLAADINQGRSSDALARLARADGSGGLGWLTETADDDGGTATQAAMAAAIAGFRSFFDHVSAAAGRPAEGPGAGPETGPVEQRHDLFEAFDRFRVLCAVNDGPRGVEAINERLTLVARQANAQAGLADDGLWYEGRPILVQANDYALGLFNGDIGLTLADADGRLRVWFPAGPSPRGATLAGPPALRGIDPVRLPRHRSAYAMTVHQAQGSEFDDILVVLPRQPSRTLSREWLYTAVTRARHRVTIAASSARLSAAIATPTQRRSGLLARFDEARRLP